MRIREPFYLYVSQAGKLDALFAACATWLLGFATWHVLYFFERFDSSISLSSRLAGPDSFASVLIGDGFALPLMSALVIVFYGMCSRLAANADKVDQQQTIIGGPKQTMLALLAAGCSAGFTYASWFTARKVDWTLPQPGMLTMAALYHAAFVTGEVYFLVAYIISVLRVLAWQLRVTRALPTEQRCHHMAGLLPLLSTTAGISIAADAFALGLLVDVGRGLMPLSTFLSTELLNAVMTVVVLGAGMAIVARYARILLLSGGWFQVLSLTALLGAVGPLLLYRELLQSLLRCCVLAIAR